MTTPSPSALTTKRTGDTLHITFNRVTRTPRSWKEELKAAALLSANSALRPVWLALSGGLASEIMARSFIEQGVNFSAFTLEFSSGSNRVEVGHAKAWCYQWGIPHKIVPFQVDDFFKTDVPAYVKAGYEAVSPYRYLQLQLMKIVEAWGGYGVIGRGHYGFIYNEQLHDLGIEFRSSFATPFAWCEHNKTSHQPYFFMSTPELALSYLRHPVVAAATATPESFENVRVNESLRRFIFQATWPEAQSREAVLGFENDHVLMHEATRIIRSVFPSGDAIKNIPLREALKQLDA